MLRERNYLTNFPLPGKMEQRQVNFTAVFKICVFESVLPVFVLTYRFYSRKRASTSQPRADQVPSRSKRTKLDSRVSILKFHAFLNLPTTFSNTKMRSFFCPCRIWNYADFMARTIQRLRRVL